MGFMHFSLHMLLCISYEGSASNIHCFELQFDLYSLHLPHKWCSIVPYHHVCIALWCNKHLCISCVLFIWSINIVSIYPHTAKPYWIYSSIRSHVSNDDRCVVSLLFYQYVPSRVVGRSNIRIIRKFEEVACGIDAALHLEYRRYDTILWRFFNTYS